MSEETRDFSRSNFVYRKQQLMAWMGIEAFDSDGYLDISKSLAVLHPSLVERNLKIADLANDINLHAEIEPGKCCCGLALEYAGMPLQAQIGHTFKGEATRVIMLDTANGIQVHCQTCNEYWPAFTSECVHHKTHEPVYCHLCMQDHVRAVQEDSCTGHKCLELTTEDEEPGINVTIKELFSRLSKKAEPGAWIFTLVILATLACDVFGFGKSNPIAEFLIDESWFTLSIVALAIWLYATYRADDKVRSAKIRKRAIGVFLWSGFTLLITEVLAKVLNVITFIVSGMGIA